MGVRQSNERQTMTSVPFFSKRNLEAGHLVFCYDNLERTQHVCCFQHRPFYLAVVCVTSRNQFCSYLQVYERITKRCAWLQPNLFAQVLDRCHCALKHPAFFKVAKPINLVRVSDQFRNEGRDRIAHFLPPRVRQ